MNGITTSRRQVAVMASLVAVVLAGVAPASAQHPQIRRGFWIGFGIGYGSADVSCDTILGFECGDADRTGSFSSFLKLGGTLRPNVLLGADITGWTKSEEGVTETLGNVSAAVFYYPSAEGGLFLKGGAGFSSYIASNSGSASGTGVGFIVGGGYDIRVGRNVSLTPVVDFLFGSVGDITEDGTSIATGWKQNVIHVALGVTFH